MSWFSGKKILVPWDYSSLAKDALRQALIMADSPEQIEVAHVTAILSATDPGVVWGTVDDATRQKHLQDAFEEQIADLSVSLPFHVKFGDPGSEICDLAEELKCDCIVLPSHGRTGLQHLLIGSVAERVVRLAHCPVIVLRSN